MPKKIKLFVDCHIFDKNFQGTTTYIKGIYLEMIADKNIHFFFAANNIEPIQQIFREQENVHYLKYKTKNKVYRLLVDIPKLIKKHKIDFAHFQYIVPPIKYCKYIVTIHDLLFLDYPDYFPLSYRIQNKFLFKWSANYSDVVLTVSEFSKKHIQKLFKIQEIFITPNAVDPIYFESYDKSILKQEVKQKYNLDEYWIYISRWEPRKNHHTLLQVFVENQFYKDYSLVFVGDKDIYNKEYEDYFETLSEEIKSKIITFNKVEFPILLQLLRGANLSIYPSFAEGFGIPPLEALAAKIPSICSNTTAMADFTFMKESTFNPYDKKDMLKIINKTIAEEFDASKVELLKANYNWKSSAAIIKNKILEK